MSLSTMMLFAGIATAVAAGASAQTARVSLRYDNSAAKEVVEEIERQTDYLFVYREDMVDLTYNVSVRANNRPVNEVLDKVFADTDTGYAVHGDNILLLPKASISQQVEKQSVSGVVRDESGPVAGALVTEQGTRNVVMTDGEGRFSLQVSPGAALRIESMGYLPQEVAVGTQTQLTVILLEDTTMLEEVVVVGYGTQKKVNLTGAVTQIDSSVFENRPVTSTVTALQGAIPGLQITAGSGGGSPNYDIGMNVRGTTSVNGGSPLVLIDGIESSLRLLNPADIESVSVLKDAAAAAVYGVRAAFGVVLITTKRGKAGRMSINYNGNFGWSTPTVLPEFVDSSYEHATFVNQALVNNNAAPLYNDQRMAGIKDYYEGKLDKDYIFVGQQYFQVGYYDVVNQLIQKTTPRQTHSLNLSGGNENTTFYASVSYHDQDGYIKINPQNYKRYNARLSVDNNTYSWLKVGFTTAYNTSTYDAPTTYKDEFWRAFLFSSPLNGGQWKGDPAYPEYDQFIGKYFQDQNQVPLLKYGGRTVQDNHEIVLTPSITITPLKGWNIHADYNVRRQFNKDTTNRKRIDELINNTGTGIVAHVDPQSATVVNDYYSVAHSDRKYYSFNAYTDYSFSLKKHNIKAMVGFNQELTQYSSYSGRRNLMINPNLPSLSLGTGDQTVSDSGYEVALRGAFGRINYDYDNRYLLEIVGRYDGTSRFPKDNRFVFLPSASIGWRLGEEKFMEFAKPLFDEIKFRASYGTLGNQMLSGAASGNMQYYPYISALSSGSAGSWLFGGDNLSKTINPPGQLPVASLTWEKVTTTNLGLDLAMLNNRLQAEFNVYWRTTDDMLMSQTLPEVLGVTAPKMNSGSLITRGWELSMSWRDRIGKDFSYSIGFNLFDSQAEITKWTGPVGTVTDYYDGKKIGEIWGYQTGGFLTADDFVDGDPSKALKVPQTSIATNWKVGDMKYIDRDGNGVVNTGTNRTDDPGDRMVVGNTTPRYQYGITGDVAWKGLSLSFFLQGVGRRDFFNSSEEFRVLGTQYYNTQKFWVENSWSEENPDPNAYFARPRARNAQNYQSSDRYIQKASYLRLKNITLAYDLPAALTSKLSLSRIQVYLSGENIAEISHMWGPYDPESVTGGNSIGTGSYTYPFARTYSVGLNVTF